MIKNSAILIFVVCCFIPVVVGQEKAVRANDSLQSLADEFWQWRARFQPFSKDDIPRLDHPAGPRDWSAASIARQRAALKDYETRWTQIGPGKLFDGWMRFQKYSRRERRTFVRSGLSRNLRLPTSSKFDLS